VAILALGAAAASPAMGQAQPKTIYDIQYTTNANGDSPEMNNVIAACAGGIVTHKILLGQPKITLYAPAFPDGWGGIQIKDWTTSRALYDHVSIGDRISLTNVAVEEYRGNTLLRFEDASGFVIEDTGRAMPAPLVVAPSAIAAPIEGPPGQWYVASRDAEKYEAMWLKVEDVTVGAMGLGKAPDNYVLSDAAGSCWAADYMNDSVDTDDYHPLVDTGQHFDSVTGILEQYTKTSSGWDYYQLVTTETGSFVVPEPTCLALLACGALAVARRRRKSPRRGA